MSQLENRLEYENTQRLLTQFLTAAKNLEIQFEVPRTKIQQAQIDAVRTIAGDLERQLHDYEARFGAMSAGG